MTSARHVWSPSKLTSKLYPVRDEFLLGLSERWFANPGPKLTHDDYLAVAPEWFKSSKLNDIQGWDVFPCVDVTMGCTHFIESFVMRHGLDGFQVLPGDYAYYTLIGKIGTEPGNLEHNKPLIVSLPNWRYGDLRADWKDVLKECELKNIDIHIDFAWLTVARNISFDLDHPNIKSFAMSMSKYNMQWNRIGVRWSKQRTIDSITLFNHYIGNANEALSTIGVYMIENIPRDYGWQSYGALHHECCECLGLLPTNLLNVAMSATKDKVLGIGNMLGEAAPYRVK